MTNIVIFDVQASGKTAAEASTALRERGVLANPTGKYTLRMVTHCDVERPGIERAITETAQVLRTGGVAVAG